MEITTGAQREHRYDVLVKQATEKGVSLESIQFYLDFFKYGCPPHGGFGFGLARLLAAMLNQKSIRDVVFLHRGPTRLIPYLDAQENVLMTTCITCELIAR